MHYSPQDLMLGAETQARIEVDANGRKLSFGYGPRPEDKTQKYLVYGLIGFGLFYLITKNKGR